MRCVLDVLWCRLAARPSTKERTVLAWSWYKILPSSLSDFELWLHDESCDAYVCMKVPRLVWWVHESYISILPYNTRRCRISLIRTAFVSGISNSKSEGVTESWPPSSRDLASNFRTVSILMSTTETDPLLIFLSAASSKGSPRMQASNTRR